jgi:hypothetical protein
MRARSAHESPPGEGATTILAKEGVNPGVYVASRAFDDPTPLFVLGVLVMMGASCFEAVRR